jgi:hypothetical protein
MIVLVHPAPVEHIPLALQYVARGNHDPFTCLVLENLTTAQMEHVPSWLEHEAGHIQCMDVSVTHPHVNEILSMIYKALPHLPMLRSIHLRRTAFALSGVDRDVLVKLCKAAPSYHVAIHMEAHVFHNSRKMMGHHLLRSLTAPNVPTAVYPMRKHVACM